LHAGNNFHGQRKSSPRPATLLTSWRTSLPKSEQKLKKAIEEVAGGGPSAEAGAARIKRMLGTASTTVGQALWKITVGVASDAARKILLGG
jgi:hypothetical protein